MTDDTLPPHDRREHDHRLAQLADDVAVLKGQADEFTAEIKRNTEITEQVHDILASFRIIAMVAKWLTAVGGFFVMAYHGWQKIAGR